ncbi:alpha/beta fold hydrolase [Kribbella koreensis]
MSDDNAELSTDGAVKNVVLVHGAFADGSGWRGVYDNLTSRGHRVTIVQIPLTSLEDDVAATTRVLDQQDGPAVLVGHSWGGTVITQAGTHDKVAGLVYVAALVPDAGETAAQQYERFAPTPEFVIDVGDDGFGFLNREQFKAVITTEDKAFDQAMLRHMAQRAGATITTVPGSHAVYATQAEAVSEVILSAAQNALVGAH